MDGTTGQSSLDVFDFGVLLQALAQSGKVGTLRITSGSREKYIYIDQGRVDAIFTPRSRFRIGRVLYNMRAVEKDDLQAVLEDQRNGKVSGPLGQILVDRGLVQPEDIEAALRYQMVEEILEVFYWRDVRYEFFGGSPEAVIPDRLDRLTRVGGRQDAHGILLHVTKVLDDVEQFNQVTPSLKDVYELIRDPEEVLGDSEVDLKLRDMVHLIDGCRDVGEVLHQARHNSFDAMELFARLRRQGLIRAKTGFELLMLAENRRGQLPARKRARLYERVSQLGIEGFDVSLRTAEAYEELERREKAAEKYYEHARHMVKQDELDLADRSIQQAIALSSEATDLRWFRVRLLRAQSRDEEAASELEAIAGIHRERGDLAAAESAIAEALEISPEDESLICTRFEVLRDLLLPVRAANVARELSAFREKNRDLTGAQEALRDAIEVRPESLALRCRLIELLARSGDPAGAAKEVTAGVRVALDRWGNRPDRARRMIDFLHDRLVEVDGKGSVAMRSLADALLTLEDRDAALELLNRAGEEQVAANRFPDARDTYARAQEIAPESLDIGETLALIHARLGSREEACVQLRQIAGHFRKRGNPERAEKAYREMLRLNPFSPDALIELANLTADQGKKKESADLLARIGQLYRASGNVEDAVTYLDEACRADPGNVAHVRMLADTLAGALKIPTTRKSLDAVLAMLRARQDHTGTIDVAFRLLEVDEAHEAARDALEEAYRALGRQVGARTAREDQSVPEAAST